MSTQSDTETPTSGAKTRDDVLPSSYQECFGCGDANIAGINLSDLRNVDDVVLATLRPQPHHQGFPGIMHGGIAVTALDEAMSYACVLIGGIWSVTAKMELKFRNMLSTDETFYVSAGITSGLGTRRFQTWGRLTQEDGTVCVEATALFLPAAKDLIDKAWGAPSAS